ncbi:MAG: hypothetical protein J7K53_12780 [Bacteroidales bacterium]|nr:hypothetical protein [Bacteroidales bacterium]
MAHNTVKTGYAHLIDRLNRHPQGAPPAEVLFNILKSRPKRVITPMNGVHKVVVMAIERGKFQNLIFDNHVLWNHRALAGVLGVILKLPPIKQVLASKQVKSRYLERLIRRLKY